MSSRKKRVEQIAETAAQLADDRDICLFCGKSEIEHRDSNRNHIPCPGLSATQEVAVTPRPRRASESAAAPSASKVISRKGSHMIKQLATATLLVAIAALSTVGCSTGAAHVVAAVDVGHGQHVCIYTPTDAPASGSCDPRAAQFRDLTTAPQSVQDAAKAIQRAANVGAR